MTLIKTGFAHNKRMQNAKSMAWGIPWCSRKMFVGPGSYSFVIPENTFVCRAIVVGGGGNSATNPPQGTASMAGPGGGYAETYWFCSPGDSLSVVVGNSQGTSSVTGPGVNISATGGQRGRYQYNSATVIKQPKPGQGSGGKINTRGGLNNGYYSGSAGFWCGNGGRGNGRHGGGIFDATANVSLPFGIGREEIKQNQSGVDVIFELAESGDNDIWWELHDICGRPGGYATISNGGDGFPGGGGGHTLISVNQSHGGNGGILGGAGNGYTAGLPGLGGGAGVAQRNGKNFETTGGTGLVLLYF